MPKYLNIELLVTILSNNFDLVYFYWIIPISFIHVQYFLSWRKWVAIDRYRTACYFSYFHMYLPQHTPSIGKPLRSFCVILEGWGVFGPVIFSPYPTGPDISESFYVLPWCKVLILIRLWGSHWLLRGLWTWGMPSVFRVVKSGPVLSRESCHPRGDQTRLANAVSTEDLWSIVQCSFLFNGRFNLPIPLSISYFV